MTRYRQRIDEVFDELESGPDGLSSDEARRRHEEHGPNRLREQTTVSAWRVLLDQFTDPLIYVLVGALIVTLAIENYADAIVVGAVLLINATIGFVQEYRAQTAVQSLTEMVSPRALVQRDGRTQEIDAEQLVPGDVVLLEQGEIVPADVRLIETSGLRVDESALTGESVPVGKDTDPIEDENLPPADQRNMGFMGTAVTAGDGRGVVTAIGTATEVGQISAQVEEAGTTETPLQQRIARLARRITVAILGVAAVAFVVGLLLGRSVTEMLLLAVALAVSAIPAGLPIVVTVALAIGVTRMAQRNALIRQLPAVDTLGSCTTIVSDKTGTLTENRMTVRALLSGDRRLGLTDDDGGRLEHHDDGEASVDDPVLSELMLVSLLCNDAELRDAGDEAGRKDGDEYDGAEADGHEGTGDPMEVALLRAGRDLGVDRAELLDRHPQRDKVPFRTEQRFMATIHDVPQEGGEGPLVLVKGAPERIAEMCDHRRDAEGNEVDIDRDEVVQASDSLAEEGLRVLAMASGRGDAAAEAVQGDDPSGFVLVGMVGLLDPPRPSAVEAVDRCHEAGIRVIMVTGDHASTAATIGRQVHLGGPETWRSDGARLEARTGQELAELSDEELADTLSSVNVFSRVAPEQKLRIVEQLKARSEVVAVTGDGVNDAPALQAAHIGAAMGSGTDVAKETSDMVITDDDFASVYAAVEEGRTAFRNIRMATFFLLSTAAAEVLLLLVALGLDWPLPLVPAQILWLNVVTNGIADVALAFEPGERALFRRPPRRTDEGILDRMLLERLVLVGVWLAAGTFAMFWWQWGAADQDLTIARTATLTTLVLFQKVHVFNCRSEDVSIFHKSPFSNKVLLAGVTASLTIHVIAMYVPVTQELLSLEPLPLTTWLVAIAVASTAIVVNELHKHLRPRAEAVARRPEHDASARHEEHEPERREGISA